MSCNNNTMQIVELNNGSTCMGSCIPQPINVVCKKMIIPRGQEIIAIEGENNSNKREFLIPKITDNGDDLTEMGFIIITKDSEGNTHTIPVSVDNIEHLENYIKIKWTLDYNETVNAGDFYVEIEAGKKGFTWKTFPGKFTITESIKPSDYEVDIQPSIVETLELDIAENSDKIELNREAIEGVSQEVQVNRNEIDNLKIQKQNNLIAGDNIELVEDTINVIGVEKVKNAYSKISKVQDYLYEIYYDSVDYDYANEHFKSGETYGLAGSCTSVRKDNWYGRNFDWFYDNETDFIIRTPKNNDRYASIGVAGSITELTDEFVESKEYSELYKILPFYLLDGINEKGLFCNVNVVPVGNVPMTKTIPTVSEEYEISVAMLPRYVLDNFATAEDAVKYLKEHVAIYAHKKIQDLGYESHFMIGDETKTYVLDIVNNQIQYKELNIMTNFRLNNVVFNNDGKVYTPADVQNGHLPTRDNLIEKFGSGLERYNLIVDNYNAITDKNSMRNLMNKLLYTRMYSSCHLSGGAANPFWYTEYVGEVNNIEYTVDTLPETFDSTLVPYYDNLYVNRTRDMVTKTWQSIHSSVYDIKERKLYIVVQEEGIEKEYVFDYYYTAKEVDEKIENEHSLIEGINADIEEIMGNIEENTRDISGLENAQLENNRLITQNANAISAQQLSINDLISKTGAFSNSKAGIIKGSTDDGKIKAETDGTGSVNGWAAILQRILNLETEHNTNNVTASNYALGVNNGSLYAQVKTLEEYQSGNNESFVSKGTLENTKNTLVKEGLTSNTIQLTEEEKTAIKNWLDLNGDKLLNLDNAVFTFDDNGNLKLLNTIDLCTQSVLYGGGESGYRKYRNGTLVQWGVATTQAYETEFTIHQAYKDMNYSVFVEPREKGNFFHYAYPSANQKFKCRICDSAGNPKAIKVQWRSYGRWK